MKEGQTLWTKEELTLAINLYSKLLFGQIHQGNPQVKALADLIGRKPGAVALKLVNFASLDPVLQQRGIKGMGNASKLDKVVWNEYLQNWDEKYMEGEVLLAQKTHTTVEKIYNINLDDYEETEGRETTRTVKVRLNQSIFRDVVLSNYNNQCCITGLSIPGLLVASHIAPWSKDKNNRLNPQNGFALNALHDKAFDKYMITVTEDFKIKIAASFYTYKDVSSIKQNFIDYDGKPLIEPRKFYPKTEFLRLHNEIFASK
ncbi:HNH endonuclease [Mucilaginibacter sp. OK283]|jgi:putative restriction endonuclease|uniref:HNH endonuclease n=1 Tax=Mucilaginibacter sp. OK283 TaxID=1881049 RepID=UPI0008D5148D|nr:HNH endonuclease [Mucilaginibacter sp. OK283]SEP36758.1 putative restriction endonuclease [Mucilaginibacter sp. OK283]